MQLGVNERLRYWFIVLLIFLVFISVPGFAFGRPKLSVFLFPETKPDLCWRVDAYLRIDMDWYSDVFEGKNPSGLTSHFLVLNSKNERVDEKTPEFRNSQTTNGQLIDEPTARYHSASFVLSPGFYKVSSFVLDGDSASVFSATQNIEVPEVDNDIRLSDLVPIEFPKLEKPPFAELFSIEENPYAFNMLLYYEVYSSVPDTTLKLRGLLQNEAGQVIEEHDYALAIYQNKRHDYFRVDVDALAPGVYSVTLAVVAPNQPVAERKFSFTIPNLLESAETF